MEFVARAHVDGIPHYSGTPVLAITRGNPKVRGRIYDGIVRVWGIFPIVPRPIESAALEETLLHLGDYTQREGRSPTVAIQSVEGNPVNVPVGLVGFNGETQGIDIPIPLIGGYELGVLSQFSGAGKIEQALHVIQYRSFAQTTGLNRRREDDWEEKNPNDGQRD
jgi:hypothetical protein